jgi:GTP-binding protein
VSLVSEIPGTTRDTVDSLLVYYGKTIRVIDTAGLRRRSRVDKEDAPEDFFSMRRTERAIQDADVVIHLIDAVAGITDLDKKIEAKIRQYNRPVLLAVNKWDLIQDKHQNTVRDYTDRIHFLFPFAKDVPIIFISAVTGQRIGRLIEISLELHEKSRFRVPTAKLNELVSSWNAGLKGRSTKSKIFYATQISTSPPEFVIFVRDAKNIPGSIVSYFENRIRDEFSLKGIPFRIHIREKKSDKKE